MMISCKCLNFTAASPQLQRNGSGSGSGEDAALPAQLSQVFVQNVPRDFLYYSNYMDFFKHAYGPIPDLTINAISQKNLICSLTLDVTGQSWQLCICINCKVVLCAKRLTAGVGVGAGATPTHYLINSTMLCKSEDLVHRRSHKSYSETFELIIMDQDDNGPGRTVAASVTTPPPLPVGVGIVNSASSLSIGSLSTQLPQDGRLQRLSQLKSHQQARLQDEINETTKRIERFSEQNFALLKSFREKSDQEVALLERLIQQLSEPACVLLDRAMPVALEVTGPAARRRNTISSRRELGVPTTPTTPSGLVQPPNFLALSQDQPQQQQQQQQQQPPQLPSASILTTRKMSNFDTPPATPEATPMSVGNSPTFRQQQQQQQQATAAANGGSLLLSTPAATSNGADDADDCLFDLEDVDGPNQVQGQPVPNFPRAQIYHHVQLQHQLSQPHNTQHNYQQYVDNMSDADEAEDALDLDSSLSIPTRAGRPTDAQMHFANFARSLPVEIANSPLVERMNNNANNNNNNNVVQDDEEVLDNTVDIAASIKALAKSVHGEAVFGDLPRPRLRSQI
ncbi:putative uncharacterized protein DDB_G0293878 [Drosophila albomicans]|uniref:Uncharacterized protein n=1 Tax=Drosophila albomicans TaxID=7291 RepID=A0A6P8XG77_DROAB|nr:putative uncharacterized protein DDB_G0293878 [Drosophila albomicans]